MQLGQETVGSEEGSWPPPDHGWSTSGRTSATPLEADWTAESGRFAWFAQAHQILAPVMITLSLLQNLHVALVVTVEGKGFVVLWHLLLWSSTLIDCRLFHGSGLISLSLVKPLWTASSSFPTWTAQSFRAETKIYGSSGSHSMLSRKMVLT